VLTDDEGGVATARLAFFIHTSFRGDKYVDNK
jgi:hypothetical protein